MICHRHRRGGEQAKHTGGDAMPVQRSPALVPGREIRASGNAAFMAQHDCELVRGAHRVDCMRTFQAGTQRQQLRQNLRPSQQVGGGTSQRCHPPESGTTISRCHAAHSLTKPGRALATHTSACANAGVRQQWLLNGFQQDNLSLAGVPESQEVGKSLVRQLPDAKGGGRFSGVPISSKWHPLCE